MRFQCKHCKTDMTSYVLKQLKGELTKEQVENACKCKERAKNEENNY